MRIKDYTDMVRHLTDPFNIPEARRMIQENPALTQEQFKAGGIVEPGVMNYGKKDHKYPEFKGLKSYWDDEKDRYVRTKKYQDFLQEKDKIKRREKFAKLPKEEQIRRLKKTPIDLRKDLNPKTASYC